MPDRELPENIRRQLSAGLDGGVPLVAPLPSQARFAALHGATPSPRWRLRALTVAVAASGIVVVALAGPPQPREWVVQTVNGISRQVGVPAGSVTPSPKEQSTTSDQRERSEPSESPETHETPGESPEPAQSPEAEESPDGDDAPQSGPAQPQASPTPGPSDGGGDGGGDHSPEPSPSSGD